MANSRSTQSTGTSLKQNEKREINLKKGKSIKKISSYAIPMYKKNTTPKDKLAFVTAKSLPSEQQIKNDS